MTESTGKDFKTAVCEWLQVEEEISNIQKIVREKRKKMNNLSLLITSYMRDIDKEICNVGDSNALVIKKSKTTCSLKKDKVYEILKSCFDDVNTAQEVTETIFNSREVREKDVLKKTNI